MMVNSYYGIYQAERGKTAAEIRAADAQIGAEREVLAPVQWGDASTGGLNARGLDLVLPCTEDPELFFAESPQDVELAKAMCRGCPVRLACLAGALERKEPWGVWGGELLMSGAIMPGKRPRGRPRKDARAFGTSSRAAAGDLAQAG
jgi:WhiB family redox-sensing transcriptional regulator